MNEDVNNLVDCEENQYTLLKNFVINNTNIGAEDKTLLLDLIRNYHNGYTKVIGVLRKACALLEKIDERLIKLS